MVALQELFGEIRVAAARTGTDDLCIGWQLPGSDKRGQRGAALALDPQHPLYKEARAVLLALAKAFPFRARRDMTAAERTLPNGKRRHDIDKVLFSKNRLRVLATLETLKGRASIAELGGAVPSIRHAVVEQVVRLAIRDGILVKDGAVVRFANASWMPPLRRLLRAYLRLRPGLPSAICDARSAHRSKFENRRTNTLRGRDVVRRVLVALALHAPLRTGELSSHVGMAHTPTGLKRLIELGVVARVERGEGKGRHFVLGLNADHPLYRELRTLLASIGGGKPSRKSALTAPMPSFTIKGLFNTPLYGNVLMAIETAVNGEIDPATICRFHAQHDLLGVMARLRSWAKDGLLQRRRFGSVVLYRFNPDYPHYGPMRAFLSESPTCSRDGGPWPRRNRIPMSPRSSGPRIAERSSDKRSR